jgi:hypothetical protein
VIPWPWFWWPVGPSIEPLQSKPPSPGPDAEHTPVGDDERAEFDELAASVWRGHAGAVGRQLCVLRCWLLTHAGAIGAVGLGASTAAVTVVDPPWSLPGVALSTGWLCVALRRRHRR